LLCHEISFSRNRRGFVKKTKMPGEVRSFHVSSDQDLSPAYRVEKSVPKQTGAGRYVRAAVARRGRGEGGNEGAGPSRRACFRKPCVARIFGKAVLCVCVQPRSLPGREARGQIEPTDADDQGAWCSRLSSSFALTVKLYHRCTRSPLRTAPKALGYMPTLLVVSFSQ